MSNATSPVGSLKRKNRKTNENQPTHSIKHHHSFLHDNQLLFGCSFSLKCPSDTIIRNKLCITSRLLSDMVRGSRSPWWTAGSAWVLWATYHTVYLVTFMSCNWRSQLKLYSYSHTLLILLQTERLVLLAHWIPTGGMLVTSNYAICAPCFTNYALLHLISLAFHLLAGFPSQYNTIMFSSYHQTVHWEHFSSGPWAAEWKVMYSQQHATLV